MNKYNQRVREIAEEMAKELFPYSYGTKHLGDVDYNCHEEKVKHYLPAARIAVKHMAEVLCTTLVGMGFFEPMVKQMLLDRGLVPTPERKEAGENYAD